MSRISPKLAKGCIVAMPSIANLQTPKLVIFQFNPESIGRSVAAKLTESPPLQFKDMPEETITLEAIFDATDYMTDEDKTAARMASVVGVAPQLSALELMIYPSVAAIIKATVAAKGGLIEVGQTGVPLTLFIWGGKMVLPVQITNLEIEEQAFNVALVPIRAKVEISLKVLSYSNFKTSNFGADPGFGLFMANHVYKEALNLLNTGDQFHHIVKNYM